MKNLVIKNKMSIIAMSLAVVMLLSGCKAGTAGDDSASGSEDAAAVTTVSDKGFEGTSEDTSDLYSNRDLVQTYDEEDAVYMRLSGESVTIAEEGVYVLSGEISDGQIIIDTDDAKVQLVLNGVSITSSNSAAIYVKSADKVFITTVEGTSNYLSNTTGFEADGNTNVDAVIFSKDDLTLNGEGSLIIESAENGITSKDDLVVTGGSYEITAGKHGLEGKDSISVLDGTFILTTVKDGLHSKNSDDSSLGNVTIDGGQFTINSEDDAIHAESALVINGGVINIESCYEGLEGKTVTVNGGQISLVASDDGINAAGDSDGFMTADSSVWIEINGGTIDVTAYGDGIDSNGDLTVNGGYLTVSGPESSADGSLDYEGTGTITGGTVIAAGASGMEMNFSQASQGSILVSVGNQSSGTEITVSDDSGNIILSYTPSTSYSSVVVSSPELEIGQTYTITAGSSSQEVTLSDYIYGQSMGMGMGGFGGPGRGGGFGFDRGDGDFTPPDTDGDFDPGNTDGDFTPPEMDGDFDPRNMDGDFTPPEMDGGFIPGGGRGGRGGFGEADRSGNQAE